MELKPGIYRHYKGNNYRVHIVVKHSETLESFVCYETLYDNPESKFWIRPLAMFIENVDYNGQTQPRFKFISE